MGFFLSRDPYIIHLNIALYMVVSLYFGGVSNGQSVYLLRSPVKSHTKKKHRSSKLILPKRRSPGTTQRARRLDPHPRLSTGVKWRDIPPVKIGTNMASPKFPVNQSPKSLPSKKKTQIPARCRSFSCSLWLHASQAAQLARQGCQLSPWCIEFKWILNHWPPYEQWSKDPFTWG